MELDGNLGQLHFAAICLFMSPAVTNAITSCSRGVRVAEFHPDVGKSPYRLHGERDPFERAGRHRACPGRETVFGRNSMAPAFMAFTVIGMSPWPVMKRSGSGMAALANSSEIEPLRTQQHLTSSTSSLGTSDSFL